MRFNELRGWIDYFAQKDGPDADRIAESIVEMLTTSQAVALLQEIVSRHARQVLDGEKAAEEAADAAALVDPTPEPEPQPLPAAPAQTASWRTAGARSLADRLRQQSVEVSETASDWQWLPLGQCTAEHLERAAALRRARAERETAQAVRFEKIRAALEEHGATTVGDLPDDVLVDVVGEEAATC